MVGVLSLPRHPDSSQLITTAAIILTSNYPFLFFKSPPNTHSFPTLFHSHCLNKLREREAVLPPSPEKRWKRNQLA